MADSKITALAALTAADPVNDMFPVVDVSDTSMAASGTTKRISANNILSSSHSVAYSYYSPILLLYYSTICMQICKHTLQLQWGASSHETEASSHETEAC